MSQQMNEHVANQYYRYKAPESTRISSDFFTQQTAKPTNTFNEQVVNAIETARNGERIALAYPDKMIFVTVEYVIPKR